MLSDAQIEEIAQAALDALGGNAQSEDDVYPSESIGEGTVMLFDEDSGEQREARIVARMLKGKVWPTQDAMKKYLKEHPDADKSLHKVEETQKTPTKEDDPSPPRAQPEKEPEGVEPKQKKPEEKPTQKPQEKPEQRPAPRKEKQAPQISVGEKLVQQVGEAEAKEWNTHTIHKNQLTFGVTVRFPDGSEKKYGELEPEEKQKVLDAMASGKAAHKGFNDYNKVDSSTYKKNMDNNLARYEDESVQVAKDDSKDEVTKDNISDFSKSLRGNGRNIIKKYSKSMSSISRPMAESYVDTVASSIEEGIKDGSLSGVSQADLDEYVQDDIKRMVHQEIESRGRSLGDHGLRHLVSNTQNSTQMLGELQKSGIKVTGRDKLMAATIMANHDAGYTVGVAATDISKGGAHKAQSETLARDEMDRYSKIFGKDNAEKIAHIIGTHDSTDIDWEADPLASSVRLSDNIALFGRDKVQDLFIRSPKAMNLACRMRLAAEANPKDAKLLDSIKQQLHKVVDSEDFDDSDKESMHRQVSEMNEDKYSTTVDILSRFSGRIKGCKFDASHKVMDVDMAYSPEGQTVDSLFGDAVAGRQFAKFVKDMGGAPVQGKTGKTVFSSKGKEVFQLDIEGFDDEPTNTATTDAMQEFVQKTARTELQDARKRMLPPPDVAERSVDDAFGVLKKSRGKFNDGEWGKIEGLFKEKRGNPDDLNKALAQFPLLESERAYLESRVARIARRISAHLEREAAIARKVTIF
jgi:outer membrane biosynthesis protein TonB